jgi:hypothetical protein
MSMLLAALLLQPTAEMTIPLGAVTIPGGLEPAVAPYFKCLRTKSAEHLTFPISDPAVMDAARDKAVSECREIRAAAARNADDVLRGQGFKAELRRRKIEALFSSFEGLLGGDLIRAAVARGRAAAAAKAADKPKSERTESPSGFPPSRQ